jgi:hypothetical protein
MILPLVRRACGISRLDHAGKVPAEAIWFGPGRNANHEH